MNDFGDLSNALQREIRIAQRQAERDAIPFRMESLANENLASRFAEHLNGWIKSYNESLDNEHEIGMRLVNFGQAITLHVNSIDYQNPSLIVFNGTTENGQPIQLIQHVSQISFCLTALKRENMEEPKREYMGFHSDRGESSEST